VRLWHGCCTGDLSELQRLRAAAGNPATASAAKKSIAQGDAGSVSGSDSGSDDDGGSDDMDTDGPPGAAPPPRRPPPQIDEDGFETVQRRTRR